MWKFDILDFEDCSIMTGQSLKDCEEIDEKADFIQAMLDVFFEYNYEVSWFNIINQIDDAIIVEYICEDEYCKNMIFNIRKEN